MGYKDSSVTACETRISRGFFPDTQMVVGKNQQLGDVPRKAPMSVRRGLRHLPSMSQSSYEHQWAPAYLATNSTPF